MPRTFCCDSIRKGEGGGEFSRSHGLINFANRLISATETKRKKLKIKDIIIKIKNEEKKEKKSQQRVNNPTPEPLWSIVRGSGPSFLIHFLQVKEKGKSERKKENGTTRQRAIDWRHNE